MYSYSDATGVFAGASVEGSVVAPRGDTNNSFYGKKVTPTEILQSNVQPPATAKQLEKVLTRIGKGATHNPARS